MSHLVLDVSGHGFGHAAQMAPVTAELRRLAPGLRLTVRSRLPEAVCRQAFGADVTLDEPAPDIGLLMAGPLDADRAATAAAYRALHAGWTATLAREARRLERLGAALLVSDVGYTALAAAAQAGLPALAVSSLSWFEIYAAYCGEQPEAPAVIAEMRAAYGTARAFLQLEPHLPMAGLPNLCPVPPVARRGQNRREELTARLGLPAATRFAVIALGGVPVGGELRDLPRLPGLVWLAPDGVATGRADVVAASRLEMPYVDLIGSAALVVTKPGYGTFVETVAAGARLIYCERPDWPETPYLDAWAQQNGVAAMVGRAALAAGDYGEVAAGLLARPDPEPRPFDGARVVAERIIAELERRA